MDKHYIGPSSETARYELFDFHLHVINVLHHQDQLQSSKYGIHHIETMFPRLQLNNVTSQGLF